MKTIYLLRHAKSSWDNESLSDFERPLNERGMNTAPFMGEVITGRGYVPSLIISSPAMRAKTTAELVIQSGDFGSQMTLDDRIYEASPNTLRQVASELGDDAESVMLVGHNPGMEGFIRYLTGLIEPMPTAALAVISLAIASWKDIDADSGTIVEIIRPKDEMRSRAA
ncbi:MAG TPA: histidine phosphatase family protein [Pyrinomonadaceae bacterium]|nr:histidine phosphatase family protein [Pyrinomonadaceae bacterium]